MDRSVLLGTLTITGLQVSMVIKTILFDFSGVIYKTPNLKWIKRWKGVLGLVGEPEMGEMLANPNGSTLVQDMCLGKVSEDRLWALMAEKWHMNPALVNHFRQRMISKRRLNNPIIKFLAELQKNYQTAILSNAGNQSRSLMEDTFHLDRYVNDIIISSEEGVIKPDHQIFQIAMERLNASPEASLLLDDTLENVLAARYFGMKAVQFINNHQAIQTIYDYTNKED